MVDIQPTNEQAISDDQELAKVLAGVSSQADDLATVTPAADPVASEESVAEPADITAPAMPAVDDTMSADTELQTVKKDAIVELRPLVDKLNLPPEEKFDTYLLLLRSTDDKTLIEPAHEAAKEIVDEARRAQALLDIIKEIDYLSGQVAA